MTFPSSWAIRQARVFPSTITQPQHAIFHPRRHPPKTKFARHRRVDYLCRPENLPGQVAPPQPTRHRPAALLSRNLWDLRGSPTLAEQTKAPLLQRPALSPTRGGERRLLAQRTQNSRSAGFHNQVQEVQRQRDHLHWSSESVLRSNFALSSSGSLSP
ncbi:hypothetical protein BCR44DRAFT_390643 [Catenaria anguillulae PL171]|uniref:Uncharacterized protein n=1 Tax=Catenaria anguillulae PL171 TaxID=765915 RepID=A0A1Y2HS53_9FUNG|nr:hypothetical protein BCR44DRAFT_390643 [Catenaria anguillulae PL171]